MATSEVAGKDPEARLVYGPIPQELWVCRSKITENSERWFRPPTAQYEAAWIDENLYVRCQRCHGPIKIWKGDAPETGVEPQWICKNRTCAAVQVLAGKR